jgi:crotonobetainyl-CoA:carnitine CoA-transferase CaiB-like acyl-CoA transferase
VRPLLEGVRVIDAARVLAAPFAARVLAEMGADVIKVEFGSGDAARGIGPHRDGRSLYFATFNSGKRGVWLDLRSDEGLEDLHKLLGSADVMVENFRGATATALGLDPGSLRARHPRLIVASVTSYARESSRGDEGVFDVTAQAESGVMSLTGEPDRPPVRAGIPISDLAAGMWAVSATLGALFARERTGEGLHVEVPMLDSTLPLLSYVATAALETKTDPGPVGSGHHSASPYGAFPTSDGWVVIAALADKFWPRLCDVLGLDELKRRVDLATNAGRVAGRAEVDGAVTGATMRMSTSDLVSALRAADVPHAPVNRVLDALSTPYVAERGIVQSLGWPEGDYGIPTTPLHDRRVALRPAPDMGEHNEELIGKPRPSERGGRS